MSAEVVGSGTRRPDVPGFEAGRIDFVDALRGVALFGILLVNLGWFSGAAYPTAFQIPHEMGAADTAAYWFVTAAAAGRFMPIFALLFGFGLMTQYLSARQRDIPATPRLTRRMTILLFFGIGHITFLWIGDILLAYALCGFLLLILLRLRAGWLVGLSVGFIVLAFLAMLALGALGMFVDGKNQANPDYPDVVEELEADFAADVARKTAYLARLGEGYRSADAARVMATRLEDYSNFGWKILAFTVPIGLLFMLQGMAVAKSGFFRRLTAPDTRLWWAPVAVLIGLIAMPIAMQSKLDGAVRAAEIKSFAEISFASAAIIVIQQIHVWGYVGCFAMLWRREALRRWLRYFEPVGKLALTNYIIQSVICTTIFYGYGFGQFGNLGYAAGIGIWLSISIAQLIFSNWYAARFRFGPLEWIWRLGTTLRVPRAA